MSVYIDASEDASETDSNIIFETICNELVLLNLTINAYTDISKFLNSKQRKISIFSIPYLSNLQFEKRIDALLEHCDLIIVVCKELHDSTVDFITRYDYPNIYYFISGFLNKPMLHSRIDHWIEWFTSVPRLYKQITVLDQLNPYQIKDKYFDILLGQERPHRDIIYNNIKYHNLDDDVIMTYLRNIKSITNLDDSKFQFEIKGTIFPAAEIHETYALINYYGYDVSLSQVIPIEIYNQTAYSIIAETNFENHYTFFTEKTVKPILAKRLFIVVAGQYFLQNLRKLGFKTFDGIIDESYDLIEDPQLRFECAFSQIKYLINQPQEEILLLIKDIVEHNQQLMLNTEWMYNCSDRIIQWYQNLPIEHRLN
jgi:hypothetical protein